MKRKLYLFALCAFLASCGTDDGSYSAPITLYEKVSGSWMLTGMKQVDELAVSAGTGMTELDLTDRFENFSLHLNVDGNMKPTTFSSEGAPALLPTAGYWLLDNDFQQWDGTASHILFFDDAAHTSQIGKVAISVVPGSVAKMELTLTRKSAGKPFVSYVYSLIPNE